MGIDILRVIRMEDLRKDGEIGVTHVLLFMVDDQGPFAIEAGPSPIEPAKVLRIVKDEAEIIRRVKEMKL